jgi:hypothetical protein
MDMYTNEKKIQLQLFGIQQEKVTQDGADL